MGGRPWPPPATPFSLLYKADFFGAVLTRASRACNQCLPLLFTSWFFFFFSLNKLVLTSISQCSDACLVFGSRLLSADGGEAVYTRTPDGTAAQEGTGHGRAMVPLSFLLHSIWEEEGEPLKGKPTLNTQQMGCMWTRGDCTSAVAQAWLYSRALNTAAWRFKGCLVPLMWEVRGVSAGSRNFYQLCCH